MPSSYAVAVIGCGGIGARHLESLARLEGPATVYAVDPLPDALARSRLLFDDWQPANGHPKPKLILLTAIEELPVRLDLAIIATRAHHRLSVIKSLLGVTHPRHLVLEKFLFSMRSEFPIGIEILKKMGLESTVVNCPRRIYPQYKAIAEQLSGASFIDIRVSASARIAPLGTIGIHFVDLLDFLCGSSGRLHCEPINNCRLVEGNRQLRDFSGWLRATINGPTRGTLTINAVTETTQPLWLTIDSDRGRFVVNERDQVFQRAVPEDAWNWRCEPFLVPLQSQLTSEVVEALLRGDDSGLTPFYRSVDLHVPLLDVLMNCYREIQCEPLLDGIPFT